MGGLYACLVGVVKRGGGVQGRIVVNLTRFDGTSRKLFDVSIIKLMGSVSKAGLRDRIQCDYGDVRSVLTPCCSDTVLLV